MEPTFPVKLMVSTSPLHTVGYLGVAVPPTEAGIIEIVTSFEYTGVQPPLLKTARYVVGTVKLGVVSVLLFPLIVISLNGPPPLFVCH